MPSRALISSVAPDMRVMTRRLALAAPSVLIAPGAGQAQATVNLEEDWRAFAQRFLLPSGRVVDTGNRNVSHSEGQGYGMLGAVRAGDQPAFERILNWTMQSLRRPGDNLLAWRWRPDTAIPVDDLNNATDGDIFIAWALAIAADVWRSAHYRRLGQAIARDILRRCIVQVDRRWVMLPAAFGFQNQNRTVVNLSYYTLPALRSLAFLAPDPAWARVEMDGLALLRAGRFGPWLLPPDWLEVPRQPGARPVPATGWPSRFSFDAVRIPLNLCWAGLASEPVVQSAHRFWLGQPHGVAPAWVDLRSNQQAPFPASSGVMAVARLAAAAGEGRGNSAMLPRIDQAQDYYSAALTLLARIAWHDLSLSVYSP